MNGSTPGERVQRVRKLRGLTQQDLARISGLSLRTIKTVEQDAGHPRVATLLAIAKALKVDTSDFMTEGEPEPQRIVTEPWEDVRAALYRQPAGQADTERDQTGVLAALETCIPDLADNRYGRVRAMLPGLIADATALGDDGGVARSRVLNATGWILTQARQWDDAQAALRLAIDAARQSGSVIDAAAAINTQCWLLLRQGRLAEAGKLAAKWADDVEPRRFSRASDLELAVWGKLLLYVVNASVRDNQPGAATEALYLARAAATRIGREVRADESTSRTFGPTSVQMIAGENAAITGRPDRVLAIAERIPPRGLLHAQSASRRRHQLDVANAHAQLRNYGEVVGVMTGLQREAPEWLAQQQYGRDVLESVLARRRGPLTPELRDLATAVQLTV